MFSPHFHYPKILVIYSEQSQPICDSIGKHLKKDEITPNFLFIKYTEFPSNETEFIKKAKECDFAIFILHANDTPEIADSLPGDSKSETTTWKDYISYFIGISVGILGQERLSFIITPDFKLSLTDVLKSAIWGTYYPEKPDLKVIFNNFCIKLAKSIKELKLRDKQTFMKDPNEMVDLLTHYSIKILNTEGDAMITRQLTLEVKKSNVHFREHRIFSDCSSTDFQNLDLRAWDENKRELGIEKIYDAPSKKEFKILFRNQLSEGHKLTYAYEFCWPKMFPKERSDFTLKSTAKKILFDLVLPNSWDLLYIIADEKRFDGAQSRNNVSIDLLSENPEGNFIRYCYQLQEFDVNIMETLIKWNWKNKAKGQS